MEVRPILTSADYKATLMEVSKLVDLDPAPDSHEGIRLDVLTTLLEAHERKNYPIDPPSAVEAIRFRMDQAGLTPADLVPYIGRLNRVYEVLSEKRSLTLAMIRRLHEGLGIPAASLIQQGAAVASRATANSDALAT